MTENLENSKWEFTSIDEMFDLMGGSLFKDVPIEKKIIFFAQSRADNASEMLKVLGINKNSTCLEIGTGCGYFSKVIAQNSKRLYCTDISESFLKQAESNLKSYENISFHKLSDYSFDFIGDSSIDYVVSSAVFIHLNIYDIYWYLKEIKRVLKSGGQVSFSIYNGAKIKFKKDQDFITAAENYHIDKNNYELLLKPNSTKAIKNLAKSLGFKSVKKKFNFETKDYPQHVFEKLP